MSSSRTTYVVLFLLAGACRGASVTGAPPDEHGIGDAVQRPPSSCRRAKTDFLDYGVGAKVAESRGAIPMLAADGRALVVANGGDSGDRGFVLITDVDAGSTRQIMVPADVHQAAPFGALVSSRGRFYTAQGSTFLELDPVTGTWLHEERTAGLGSADYLAFTEGADGRIWAAGVYETRLVSYEPDSGRITYHGRLDDEEEYVYTLATDDRGWVYAGIGTSRLDIVAYNPTTGQRRSLIAAADRKTGRGEVFPAADGSVTGRAGTTLYRLSGGAATPIAAMPPQRDVRAVSWGATKGRFPDGRKLLAYSMEERYLEVGDQNGGVRRISFSYETEGSVITSVSRGASPSSVLASSAHPMHLLQVDTCKAVASDIGFVSTIGGGNIPAFTAQGDLAYGASYSDGSLWAIDEEAAFDPDGLHGSLNVTGGVTIEAWLEARVPTGARAVIVERGAHAVSFALDASARLTLTIGDGNADLARVDGHTPVAGAWHHVAATYDAATGRAALYVDGVEDGRVTIAPAVIGTVASPLVVGASAANTPHADRLAGRIDELFVYATALGGAEIASRARGGDAGTAPIAAWGFDERSGERAWDASGFRNPLRVPSGSWTSGHDGGALALDGIGAEGVTHATNPERVAQFPSDIARPRGAFAHPDGIHVGMVGFAGYGLCGGGLGIYDRSTGTQSLVPAANLLPGHSAMSVAVLPSGDLVMGTSVRCPGGGVVTQSTAELVLYDWATRRVRDHVRPVPGDAEIPSVVVAPSGLVYGLTQSAKLFVFDPITKSLAVDDWSVFGKVPMHALQVTPGGAVYALMSRTILRIDPTSFAPIVIAEPPMPIDAGGAFSNGSLYYASGSHLWSFRVPSAGPPIR